MITNQETALSVLENTITTTKEKALYAIAITAFVGFLIHVALTITDSISSIQHGFYHTYVEYLVANLPVVTSSIIVLVSGVYMFSTYETRQKNLSIYPAVLVSLILVFSIMLIKCSDNAFINFMISSFSIMGGVFLAGVYLDKKFVVWYAFISTLLISFLFLHSYANMDIVIKTKEEAIKYFYDVHSNDATALAISDELKRTGMVPVKSNFILGLVLMQLIMAFFVAHIMSKLVSELSDEIPNVLTLIHTQNDSMRELEVKTAIMQAERKWLTTIQRMALPVISGPEVGTIHKFHTPDIDVDAIVIPADDVGGDFYDVYYHPSGKTYIWLGDVMGHGLQSCIVMSMLQTLLYSIVSTSSNDASVVDIYNTANKVFFSSCRSKLSEVYQASVLLLCIENDTMTVVGQLEKFLIKTVPVTGPVYIRKTDTKDLGIPVGLLEDVSDGITDSITIQLSSHLRQDTILLFTDGVIDCRHKDTREPFGIDNLERSFTRTTQIAKITQDVLDWSGGNLEDDLTMISLKKRV